MKRIIKKKIKQVVGTPKMAWSEKAFEETDQKPAMQRSGQKGSTKTLSKP